MRSESLPLPPSAGRREAWSAGALAIVAFVLFTAAFYAALVRTGATFWHLGALPLAVVVALRLPRTNGVGAWAALGVCMPLSLLLSVWLFDISFDGIDYHQEAILGLETHFAVFGWDSHGLNAIWVDNYPKLSWWFGAALASVFGSVHVAKAIHPLLMCAVFMWAMAIQGASSPSWYRIMFGLAAALNPIAISQVFSHYVDGALSSCMTMAVLACLGLTKGGVRRDHAWLMLLLSLIGMAALKFTGCVFAVAIGVVFLAIRCFVRMGWWQTMSSRAGDEAVVPTDDHLGWARRGGVIALALVLLYNPYGWHVREGRHVFHPAMGPQKVDNLLSSQTTLEFLQLNPAERLFRSVFAASENLMPGASPAIPALKLPLSVRRSELQAFTNVDVRVGGWGPLFGGSALLGMIGWLLLPGERRDNSWVLMLLVLLVALNQHGWWARLNPQVYILVLMLGHFCSLRSRTGLHFAAMHAMILLVNAMLVFAPMAYSFDKNNKQIAQKVKAFAAMNPHEPIHWHQRAVNLGPVLDRLGIAYTQDAQQADHVVCQEVIYGEQICVKRSAQRR